MNKKLLYIKANGNYYEPHDKNEFVKNGLCEIIKTLPVCYIKKRLFGIYQIDMFDEDYQDGYYGYSGNNQKPNIRLYLYPSGIEEIRYKI